MSQKKYEKTRAKVHANTATRIEPRPAPWKNCAHVRLKKPDQMWSSTHLPGNAKTLKYNQPMRA